MKTKSASRRTTYWPVPAAVVLAMVLANVAAQPPESEPIVVNKSPSAVTFVGGTAKVMGRLKVRIAGPDGRTVFESISESGLIDWIPGSDLPDGHYRWDAWFVPASGPAKKQASKPVHQPGRRQTAQPGVDHHYQSGIFHIRDGSLEDAAPSKPQAGGPSAAQGLLGSLTGRIVGFLMPTAKAAEQFDDSVTILDQSDDSVTVLELHSRDTSGDLISAWQVKTLDGRLSFTEAFPDTFQHHMAITTEGNVGIGTPSPAVPLHIADTVPRLRFEDTDGFGSSGPTAWTISASSDEFRLQDNDGGGRPLVIDAGGDSGGAPTNSLFIAADGDIGLGTSTPESDLHVVGPSGALVQESTASGQKWAQFVGGGSGSFLLHDFNSGLIPFIVRAGAPTSSLDIDSNGNVGMGTFDIETALHVERSDGSAKVLVRESSSTAAARELFKLSNNGGPFFIFENRDISESYSFAMGATGHFLLSHQQTSGVQFRLRPDGSAVFQGDVTANGVLLTSSRESKTDFAPVDEQTVLEKVTELDVSQWRYRREPESARHVGPMAEDFQEVFGLGDGEHISAGDAQGILFATAKALESRVEAKERRIEALESRLEKVEALLDRR